MSNYKHGNWYCKPANEAEAIEIVERAVASGAELFESVAETFCTLTPELTGGAAVPLNELLCGTLRI